MITIEGLWSGYGSIDILRGVDLTVERGTINCIVGPNGAGKSTLLKTVNGLLAPTRGRVVIDGLDVTGLSPRRLLQMGVAQVPQRHGLFSKLSVRRNVEMGAYALRPDRAWLSERYEALAEIFAPLKQRPHVSASALSGGQRRMVEFARALMIEPTVVLLDEPTLGLDPYSLGVIRDSIHQMHETGATILMVEQNVRFGLSMAHDATVMSAGEVSLVGTAKDISEHPSLMSIFFGDAATEQPGINRVH